MAGKKFADSRLGNSLEARIAALEARVTELEAGVVATRDRLLHEGRPILIDTTTQTIARDRQWIMDLRALAEETLARPKAAGKRAAVERARGALN